MTNFSSASTNTMGVFGSWPTQKWGNDAPYTMAWGTSVWAGKSQDLVTETDHLFTDSITPDSALSQFVEAHVLTGQTLSLSSEATTSETLQDSAGWYYVFTLPTTEAEERNLTTWTEL